MYPYMQQYIIEWTSKMSFFAIFRGSSVMPTQLNLLHENVTDFVASHLPYLRWFNDIRTIWEGRN